MGNDEQDERKSKVLRPESERVVWVENTTDKAIGKFRMTHGCAPSPA